MSTDHECKCEIEFRGKTNVEYSTFHQDLTSVSDIVDDIGSGVTQATCFTREKCGAWLFT